MRLTNHNGRGYSPRHNDRNFDLTHADHIDKKRSDQNRYWHCYQKQHPELTFEQAEHLYYESHYKDHLDKQNLKHIQSRHIERCKDYLDYYKSKRSCPEETIIQIGKKGDTIDSNKLWDVVKEQLRWEREQFPQVKQLSIALHVDETTPHIHIRKVWESKDEHGDLCVSQSKSLEQMGIRDPEGRRDRYHNPKIEYSRQIREHFMEVCKRHGLDLETEPKETSEVGLSLLEYKGRMEKERLVEVREEVEKTSHELQELKDKINSKYNELSRMETLERPKGLLSLSIKMITERDKLETLFRQAEEYVRRKDDFDKLDDVERIHEQAQQVLEKAKVEARQIIDDAKNAADDIGIEQQLQRSREISELRSIEKKYNRMRDLLREQYDFDLDKVMQEQERHHSRSR